MAYDSSKPDVSQTIGDVIRSSNANDVALKLQIDIHENDNSKAHGIDALLATQAEFNSHAADSRFAHGIGTTNANVAALLSEVSGGRGVRDSLSSRLNVALNSDGSIRLSTLNNKWISNGDVPTFVDATRFTVPGDKTLMYIAGAQLRLTISANYAYAPVASRSFGGGVTTVVLDPGYPILTSGLSSVELALIAWDNAVAQSCTTNAADISSVQGQVTELKIEKIEDWISGMPGAGAVVKRFIAARSFSIPSAVDGAVAKANIAATASAQFTLAKNGSAFGSMTFPAAGTVATFAAETATNFVAGDLLTITAPASQDATLADIAFNLKGVMP